MSDFINDEPVKVEINGKEYLLKELTGVEYDNGTTEYISVFDDGTYKMDMAKKNTYFLKKCVVDAPYDLNGRPFKDLSEEQRFELLNKLKPSIRDAILKEIGNLHSLKGDVTKN